MYLYVKQLSYNVQGSIGSRKEWKQWVKAQCEFSLCLARVSSSSVRMLCCFELLIDVFNDLRLLLNGLWWYIKDIKASNQVETTQKGSEWLNESTIQKLMQFGPWNFWGACAL